MQYLHLDIHMTHSGGISKEHGVRGHDPREDAYAALMLAEARAEAGEGWGLPPHRQRSSVFRKGGCGRAVLLKRVEGAVGLVDVEGDEVAVGISEKEKAGKADAGWESTTSDRWGFNEGIEDALYGGEGELAHIEGSDGDVTAKIVEEVKLFRKAEGERLRAKYGKEKTGVATSTTVELPRTLFLSAS